MTAIYEGKSKIVKPGPEEGTVIIAYKDTATAGNGEKRAEFSGKGKLNARISNLIYAYLEKNGVRTHLIRVIDDTTILAKKAEIVQVEVIVRNVAAGSFSKRFGVPEGTALLNTVVEFSLKSDALGDPMINVSQITALGIATEVELSHLKTQALRINELLCKFFLRAGIQLVDFKLEFGRCGGELLLCDEISPDSCRLWDVQTGEKLDKDRFRRDLGDLLTGYEDVLRRLMQDDG